MTRWRDWLRPEAGALEEQLKEVAVEPGGLPLAEAKDVARGGEEREDRDPEGGGDGEAHPHQEEKE